MASRSPRSCDLSDWHRASFGGEERRWLQEWMRNLSVLQKEFLFIYPATKTVSSDVFEAFFLLEINLQIEKMQPVAIEELQGSSKNFQPLGRNGLPRAENKKRSSSYSIFFNGFRTAKGSLFCRRSAGSNFEAGSLSEEQGIYPGPRRLACREQSAFGRLHRIHGTVGKTYTKIIRSRTATVVHNSTSHKIRIPIQRYSGLTDCRTCSTSPKLPCFWPTFSFPRSRHWVQGSMDSSRAEEQRVESTGINLLGVDDRGEAGRQEAGTSLAGEIQVDAGDVAAPKATSVQQHGAGKQPENEGVAKARQDTDAVFGAIEDKLKEQDDRERRLAQAYRDSQKRDKQAAKKARERLGYKRVESDEDTNDDDSCYIEIKNLVLIDDSVIHKKALEEWDRKRDLLAKRVERKSTKVESQKNEVYQLVGFFSVFQGVVLTAVSQSNLLHCNNRWSPILLSLLASTVTIAGVFQKLMQISSLEETIYSEEQTLKDVVRRGQALRREGKNFVFAQFKENKKKVSKEGYSTWYAVGVLSFLVVFTVVFPVSHWRILCDYGRNPYGGAPPT